MRAARIGGRPGVADGRDDFEALGEHSDRDVTEHARRPHDEHARRLGGHAAYLRTTSSRCALVARFARSRV